MITKQDAKFIQYGANGTAIESATYFGLSTDTKPTANVGNGSAFLEMHTGKVFFYDVENDIGREM